MSPFDTFYQARCNCRAKPAAAQKRRFAGYSAFSSLRNRFCLTRVASCSTIDPVRWPNSWASAQTPFVAGATKANLRRWSAHPHTVNALKVASRLTRVQDNERTYRQPRYLSSVPILTRSRSGDDRRGGAGSICKAMKCIISCIVCKVSRDALQ